MARGYPDPYMYDDQENGLGPLLPDYAPPDAVAGASPQQADAPPATPPDAAPPPEAPQAADQAPEAPAVQSPALPASADADPLASLLDNYQPQQGAQPPPFDLPPPPMKNKPQEGPAILGLILNLALNRGRGVSDMVANFAQNDDTDYENYRRAADYAKTRYALTAPRRAGIGGGLTPMQAALQAERLRQGGVRLGMGADSEKRRAQALADAEKRDARMNTPGNETAKSYESTAIAAGLDPKLVSGKSAAEIAKLAPSVNFGAQRSGQLGALDTSHAADKAGAEAAATEASKIRIAEAGALAQAGARGDEMERARLATLTATRNIGEAELKDGLARGESFLRQRKGGAMGAKLTPDAMLLDKEPYLVLKQQIVDAATKMVTGGAPHETEIRAMLAHLPNYEDINAEEKLHRIGIAIMALGSAGGAALQETKEAPRPIKRPNAAQKPTAGKKEDDPSDLAVELGM